MKDLRDMHTQYLDSMSGARDEEVGPPYEQEDDEEDGPIAA